MQLSSLGTNHHQGKRVPARILDLAAGAPLLGDPDRMKLVVLEKGNGVLSEEGAAEALVAPALALVGRAGRPGFTAGEGTRGLVLFFHPQYLNDELSFEAIAKGGLSATGLQDRFLLRHFVDREDLRARIAQLEPLSAQRLLGFFGQMRRELEEQPDGYWPCRSRSYFLQIVLVLDQLLTARAAVPAIPALPVAQAVPWVSASTSDDALRPVIAHLVSHCHEELTVESLARVFATNRTTLQARFKKATGFSLGQYVIRLRVQIAAHLLRDTSLAVAEIMERTGFNDPSHFARTFKRHSGRSPSDFRALFRVPGYIAG